MRGLFEKVNIGKLNIDNRFIRSATWEGLAADDGASTPALTGKMIELAAGGVGLIITGHAFIRKDGQASTRQLGADRDACIPGLREMVKAVHDRGGKIVLQLAHAGYYGLSKLTGQVAIAPSATINPAHTPRKEMDVNDIREITSAFVRAAERGFSAGFDGVQIHAAHGYLLSQFLSPYFNRREDEYGGSAESRARILRDVVKGIRLSVGQDYPVLVKLNCRDFLEGGLDLNGSLEIAGMLCRDGIDAVEMSGGTIISGRLSPSRPGIDSIDSEAYFQDAARAFQELINVPLILVGGIRSYETASKLIREGIADFVSMSRPLIREPGLVNRWKSGDIRRAACISDNLCFGPAATGRGICCMEKEGAH